VTYLPSQIGADSKHFSLHGSISLKVLQDSSMRQH
jgi:hypothetical protein